MDREEGPSGKLHREGASAKVALVTGVTGQDGSYLAELLLDSGWRVVGTTRSRAPARLLRIEHIVDRIELVEDDLLDQRRIERLLERVQPGEIYNLAARASSADLNSDPIATGEVNGLAVTRLLEAVRVVNPRIRFFQALSSELFGIPDASPQSESTPFSPTNSYAAAKLYAYWAVRIYREQHGLHASSGILFNHESPRRDIHFVTRKITRAVALIKAGRQKRLELGSLEARRDWSFAGDFARAMLLIVAYPQPDDYVVASGVAHSVGEFCEIAFARAGLDYRQLVAPTPDLARPADPCNRVGNPRKAESRLGWKRQVTFEGLISMMVDHDLSLVRNETEIRT
jgi:GDPmannose 4,6-dehydratase